MSSHSQGQILALAGDFFQAFFFKLFKDVAFSTGSGSVLPLQWFM